MLISGLAHSISQEAVEGKVQYIKSRRGSKICITVQHMARRQHAPTSATSVDRRHKLPAATHGTRDAVTLGQGLSHTACSPSKLQRGDKFLSERHILPFHMVRSPAKSLHCFFHLYSVCQTGGCLSEALLWSLSTASLRCSHFHSGFGKDLLQIAGGETEPHRRSMTLRRAPRRRAG